MIINNEKFKGIFPALLTPFDENDNVNVTALTELVHYNIAKGVAGFYVGGSTAEAFLLSENERKLVYKTVAKATKGKVTLIAHIGCISTVQAIEFGKYAKEQGYVWILLHSAIRCRAGGQRTLYLRQKSKV